jgi:hypothetical protein
MPLKITQLLLEEIDREAVGSSKAPEHVPALPAWIERVVDMDEIDISPPGGPKFKPQPWKTRPDLLDQLKSSLKKGREIPQKTTDDHLFNTK